MNREFTFKVDRRELATILAALRFHQDENLQTSPNIPDRSVKDITGDCGSFEPLDFDEVGSLCERLNLEVETCAHRKGEEDVTQTKEQINIAQIVYGAYPHADLLPIDAERDCHTLEALFARVTGENIGDGLFTFLVVEIVEGGQSKLSEAIRVLEKAKADVEAVLRALRDADPEKTI